MALRPLSLLRSTKTTVEFTCEILNDIFGHDQFKTKTNLSKLRWRDDSGPLTRALGLPKSCQMDLGALSAQPSEAMAAETWARTAKARQVRRVRARGIPPNSASMANPHGPACRQTSARDGSRSASANRPVPRRPAYYRQASPACASRPPEYQFENRAEASDDKLGCG
jgi:hypothetical protein